MSSPDFSIRLENPSDSPAIETLTAAVFGPGMFSRAAFALREGIANEMPLSFVAESGGEIVGSVRLTKILWGDRKALMLGPLGVHGSQKKRGIGRALMKAAVEAARQSVDQHDCGAIMLVGDFDYYKPFGFVRIAPNKISLPRPADPARVLGCELIDGALGEYSGSAERFSDR